MMTGLLALNVPPASAAVPLLLNNGYGEFTAVSAVSSPNPSAPCALYSEYRAHMEFVVGTSTYTFATTSHPTKVWGENGDGTFASYTLPAVPSTTCNGQKGQVVNGFTGTLTGNDGTTPVVCTFNGNGNANSVDGTYRRGVGTPNPELNVEFTAKLAGPACPAAGQTLTVRATIPDVALPPPYLPPFFLEYASACNGVIAPQSCVLGPASW